MDKDEITELIQRYGHRNAFVLMMLYNSAELFVFMVGWMFAIPTAIGLFVLCIGSGMSFTTVDWPAVGQWGACWMVGFIAMLCYAFVEGTIEHEWKSYVEKSPMKPKS